MSNSLLWSPSLAVAALGLTACAPEAPDEPAATSDLITWQDTKVHGDAVPGLSIQSASLAGVTQPGGTLGAGTAVSGTAIYTWYATGTGWEQRWPDHRCLWNSTRTTRQSCTNVNLAIDPSPLAGTQFQATFLDATGTPITQTVEIGTGISQQGAVVADTSFASFALAGSSAAINGCPLIPVGGINPPNASAHCDSYGAGCRVNCDVWQYDLRLPNLLDSLGEPTSLCPAGSRATALAGTWDPQGMFHASTTQLTFTCSTGAVEKCVRWGYRPWDSSLMSDGTNLTPLASYHQSCVHAAMADYCGNGTSFTTDGTLVSIYDWGGPDMPGRGFIFATNAFDLEAIFDNGGAYRVDHVRHPELAPLTDPMTACAPGQFTANASGGWNRTTGQHGTAIAVNSGPSCSHSEWVLGRFLDEDCNSTCLSLVYNYHRTFQQGHWSNPYAHCFSAALGGWTADCVSAAQAVCTLPAHQMMTTHSECTAGAGLRADGSQCTELVTKLRPACGGAWDETCVQTANAVCTGGVEGTRPDVGFCGGNILVFHPTGSL